MLVQLVQEDYLLAFSLSESSSVQCQRREALTDSCLEAVAVTDWLTFRNLGLSLIY